MENKSLKKKTLALNAIKYVLCIIAIVSTILVLYFSFFNRGQDMFLGFGIGILFVSVLGILICSLVSSYILDKYLYRELYLKTIDTYNEIENFSFDFNEYGKNDEEFVALNRSIDNIKDKYSKVIFYKKDIEIHNLNLVHESDEILKEKIYTKESFVNSVSDLVEASFCFRNAFLIIRYDTKEKEEAIIDNNEIVRIHDLIESTFKTNNVIVAKKDDYSLYAFIRNIDSLSSLEFLIHEVIKNYSFINFKGSHQIIYTLKVGAVVYPYSQINEILGDLYYVDKKKNNINIFVPNRLKDSREFNNQVQKLNYMSLMIEEILDQGSNVKNGSDFKHNVLPTLEKVRTFLHFDTAGFIVDHYGLYFEVNNEFSSAPTTFIFKNKEKINQEFIDLLIKNKSRDDSLYFASRDNVTGALAVYLDKYSISSGYFYLFFLEGKFVGAVYFLNKDREIFNDFVDKETLSLYSNVFKSYYIQLVLKSNARDSEIILHNVLKSDCNLLYEINTENYELFRVYDGLEAYFKNAKNGAHCYKALFGLNSPCKDCPLATGKNRLVTIDGVEYSSSIKYTVNSEKRTSMVLKPIDRDSLIGKERFDSNLFIGSFYSFNGELVAKFIQKSKGYILLCRLENVFDVVSKGGENTYNTMIKDITRKLNLKGEGNKAYVYNSNTLAFIFNEHGRGEIFDHAELINHIIKHKYFFKGEKIRFSPTLFLFNYPLDYESVDSFFRMMEKNLNKTKSDETNKLYLVDQHISRFASQTDYTFSLLEKAYKEHNLDLVIKPIFHNKTSELSGGKVILRLHDELRDEYISNKDIITVIGKEHRIYDYTNLIIDQLGKYYSEANDRLFRVTGVDRLLIMAYSGYFLERVTPKENGTGVELLASSYADKLQKAIKEYGFSKNFLSLLFDYNDFKNNLDLLKDVPHVLDNLGIDSVITNFDSEGLELEEIASYGIHEVCLSEEYVNNLVDNKSSIDDLSRIVAEAKAYNIKLAVKCVASKEVSDIVKSLDLTFMEGEYYSGAMNFDEFAKYADTHRK